MNKNIVIVFTFIIVLGGFLYGVSRYYAPKAPIVTTPNPQEGNYMFVYLTSAEETTAYCDGENMNSAGYRASLRVKNTGTIQKSNPTTEEIIRATINAGTTGMCHTVMNQTTFTEKDGIVTVSPIDAWAGVSISMCSCKPQVEVNILQIPGMKQVIWSEATE